MFTRTYEETAANSRTRREHFENWTGQFSNGRFDWVVPPILNPYTRLAVEMCPAKGVLRAVGYEAIPGAELPQAVTLTCDLQASSVNLERNTALSEWLFIENLIKLRFHARITTKQIDNSLA